MVTRWSRSTSNFYALIGQNWQVSSCGKFMQHLESCLLWQLKLTEFCVNLWCFFNCFFPLDAQNEIQLLSGVFCYSWLAGAHQMEPPSPLISWVNPFPSRFINRTASFPRKVSYFRESRMKSKSEARLSTVFLFYYTSIFTVLQPLGSGMK